jgi:hypothetical protein
MRTTLAIADNLLAAAKREARRRGLTLGQLIEAALQRELSARGGAATRPVVPVLSGRGGLRPGVDATSNRALLDLLDEGTPIEQLR